MWETVPPKKEQPKEQSENSENSEKYFSFQIKAWTHFDPMGKTLAQIAESVEEGGGFLTQMEVLGVEDDLAAIGDEEVREYFANVLAVKRLVKNVHELSKKLIEELHSALEAEEKVVPKKPVLPVESTVMNHGSRAKPWP